MYQKTSSDIFLQTEILFSKKYKIMLEYKLLLKRALIKSIQKI